MPSFFLKTLIGLQGCSKGGLFLGTRAPREPEGIIDSQAATRKGHLSFFFCFFVANARLSDEIAQIDIAKVVLSKRVFTRDRSETNAQ